MVCYGDTNNIIMLLGAVVIKEIDTLIQDIAPHQFSNEYRPQKPDANSYILYYRDKELLIKMGVSPQVEFPTFSELAKCNENIYNEYIYLFTIDDDRYYLMDNLNYQDTEYKMENVSEKLRNAVPLYKAFAGATGSQLYRWYRDHKFCGRCGKEMRPDERERMLYCDYCANMEYPKIMPAVIVGVISGNRILMSKYADRDYSNYALLAGFVEIGEALDKGIRREIMEEVGLKIKNIRYYKSQPWGFSDTLLLGFFVDLDGDDTVTLDENELSMAKWFEREEIPVREHNFSLTNEMIMQFKNGLV